MRGVGSGPDYRRWAVRAGSSRRHARLATKLLHVRSSASRLPGTSKSPPSNSAKLSFFHRRQLHQPSWRRHQSKAHAPHRARPATGRLGARPAQQHPGQRRTGRGPQARQVRQVRPTLHSSRHDLPAARARDVGHGASTHCCPRHTSEFQLLTAGLALGVQGGERPTPQMLRCRSAPHKDTPSKRDRAASFLPRGTAFAFAFVCCDRAGGASAGGAVGAVAGASGVGMAAISLLCGLACRSLKVLNVPVLALRKGSGRRSSGSRFPGDSRRRSRLRGGAACGASATGGESQRANAVEPRRGAAGGRSIVQAGGEPVRAEGPLMCLWRLARGSSRLVFRGTARRLATTGNGTIDSRASCCRSTLAQVVAGVGRRQPVRSEIRWSRRPHSAPAPGSPCGTR